MILYNSEKSNIFTQKNIKKLQNVKLVEILTKVIEEYEDTLNFGYLTCPNCECDELISYGTYERYIVANGVSMPITIKRVMCKHCGRTHAIIPSFLMPYFQHLASFINSIIILAIVKKNKNKRNLELVYSKVEIFLNNVSKNLDYEKLLKLEKYFRR